MIWVFPLFTWLAVAVMYACATATPPVSKSEPTPTPIPVETKHPEAFILADGTRIGCESFKETPCGLTLTACGLDRKRNFECVKGAKHLGQVPLVPPDYAPEAQEDLK